MNENIDLTKILKDCPKGTKFYSTIFGEVEFYEIREESEYPIVFITTHSNYCSVTTDGRYYENWDGECTLFPSKEQRDWSKFTAPWYKKEKFDPKTLQKFDKVLVRDKNSDNWCCGYFSHINVSFDVYRYVTGGTHYKMCIPYNEDTKHLVGTTDEAPEYYRYWEN